MLTTANPAVRVAAAWKRPSRNRKAGGRTVTVGSLSYTQSVSVCRRCRARTHIEDDEENQVDTVQSDKHSKQPPISFAGKQQREASTRVVKQEPQFFPNATAFGHELRGEPDDEAEHTWEPSISNDDQEGAQKQG